MGSVEQRARELLAAEYQREGIKGVEPEVFDADRAALRAIAAALREQPEARGVVDDVMVERARQAYKATKRWSTGEYQEGPIRSVADMNRNDDDAWRAALTAAQQPEDLKAWSLRMAQKEQDQHVSAGSHGIEDVPVQEGDGELPGMWSASDFTGSDPEERAQHRAMRTAPPSAPVGVEGRWVTQTEFYDPNIPNEVASGNCTQAAVASILGLPLSSVPSWTGLAAGEFWDAFDAFLESHGFDAWLRDSGFQPTGMYLASGPSERGCSHMVVMRNGQLLHDPHPSRTGVKSVEHVWMLVPRDPAALAQQPAQAAPLPASEFVGATARVRDCNCRRYDGRNCRKCFRPPYPDEATPPGDDAAGGGQ